MPVCLKPALETDQKSFLFPQWQAARFRDLATIRQESPSGSGNGHVLLQNMRHKDIYEGPPSCGDENCGCKFHQASGPHTKRDNIQEGNLFQETLHHDHERGGKSPSLPSLADS